MDPRHRDRIAFVRVCSGRFEKDMVAARTAGSGSRCGRRAPTGSSAAIARRSASPMPATSSAWSIPGSSPSATRCIPAQPLRLSWRAAISGRTLRARAPEGHALQTIRRRVCSQLEEEGLMQVFYTAAGRREPIVGVVGALQLDVITQPAPQRIQRGCVDRTGHVSPPPAGSPIRSRDSHSEGRESWQRIVSSARSFCSALSGSCNTSAVSTRASNCSKSRRRSTD